ncbi:MAG: carbohydrate kinase [Bacteroidales bacterium]
MTKKVICFGEMLWDVFPDQKIAGGAPMNVAIRLQSLGIQSSIISGIGNDKQGKELLSIVNQRKVDVSFVQVKDNLPTGEVKVSLKDGIPSYDIIYPSAWDKIETNPINLDAVALADAFVFGSLACRDEVSSRTLQNLIDKANFRVFDINIRKPFFNLDMALNLMKKSNLIKLNDEELSEIATQLGAQNNDLKADMIFISEKTGVGNICVTRGKNGAIYLSDGKFYENPGYMVKVEDTVGAGDSFLAAFLSGLLNSREKQKCIDFACAMGAMVASRKGANPFVSEDDIQKLVSKS